MRKCLPESLHLNIMQFLCNNTPLQKCCTVNSVATHFRETTAAAKSRQSCPTLCDPIDGSPPGSPVPGVLQARMCYCSPRKLIHWARLNFMFVHTLYPDPSPPHNNINLDIEPRSCCRLTSTLHKIYSEESHCPLRQPASIRASPLQQV